MPVAPDNPALKEAAESQCLGPELVDDLREDPHPSSRFAPIAPDNPALKEAAQLQCLGSGLLDDLREDPHRFFRFVAHSFVSLSCVRVAQGLLVNLHGDVHLEQYLVSSLGRGLGDFDDAGIGPVGVDLLRIATWIRIASRVRAWDADRLWGRLLSGYVRALDAPDAVAAEPAFAHRARAGFHNDHARLLAWTKTVFKPVSDEEALWIESERASEEVCSAWSNLNLRANYDSDLGRTCQ